MSSGPARNAYRSIRDRILARVFDAAALWAVRQEPSRASRVGQQLGTAAYQLLATERDRAAAHLALAFPNLTDDERDRLALEAFRHLGENLVEILRIVGGGGNDLIESVRWIHREKLQEAASRGRGVILVTGHCGNWELLGAATVAAGFPLTVVARGMKDPALEARAAELRSKSRMATAIRDTPGASRNLLGALRSGGCLGMLIDQDIDAEGAFVPFFGRPAWTATGAALLAVRRGTPFVPILTRRTGNGRHEIEVFDEIAPPPGADHEEAAIHLTSRATAVIEGWIRKTPEQWVWMHRRWKRERSIPATEPLSLVGSAP